MLIAARSCQDFALLRPRDRERTLEMRLRFHRIRFRRSKRDFAGHAMDLGLAPSLLGCLNRSDRFANTAPGIIELTEFRIGSRQI
jgi:hypothetical protein